MSRKKDLVKGGASIARIRESSRLMRTHESMVDLISGRHSGGSIMDVFASGLLGFDFLRSFDGDLEDDLIYSDDEDDYHVYPHNAAHGPLEPHPRIRQLSDEEANKHEEKLIEEMTRQKERTQRNKRKKMRKKERKRIEKENAGEEQGKSDSSENHEENPVIENNAEANESSESGKTQNATEAAGRDESSGDNNKEDNPVTMNKKEDEEQKSPQQDLDLNNSYTSSTKSEPEETCSWTPARERKKGKKEILEIHQSKEEKPKVVEKPEVQKKEEKQEPNKEKTLNPTAEEFAKRSRELAGIGNRLAASGQYEQAVQCFTDAIKYNPQEYKLFGNRSLCYERMQQCENALRDADVALSMEPNWIKGLFRKGKALCGLKRYYEASLIYKEVLTLESSSAEATRELKRAQTLHLMEMGFNWSQSSEALKTHATLEGAVEALFAVGSNPGPGDAGGSRDLADQPVVQEYDSKKGEWIVLQPSRQRTLQVQNRSKSQSPTPLSRSSGKPELYPIWVGSLAPTVTYTTLHELFDRAGTVYSIKMLLEHQCAFVNYTRKEDCDRAIECINGMVVEGVPLAVRYPSKTHTGLGVSKSAAMDSFSRSCSYKKECFFWRTTGCTRGDCIYKHVPEHKNIDKDKFTNRLGNVGNQK